MRLEQLQQLLAVGLRMADKTLHEIAENERAFAGFRMDADDRVLGLVDRAGEHFLEVFSVRLGGARADRGIVVGIAVHGPELFGEPLQGRRQVLIRGCGIGPDGVAAEFGNHDAAQHGEFGIGVDEGHVGMPLVCPAAAAAGIQLED